MDFAARFNKHYDSSTQFEKRMGNWKMNHYKVAELNQLPMDAVFADNFTSDLDADEYRAMLGAARSEVDLKDEDFLDEDSDARLLSSLRPIDWVGQGKVAGIKD